MLSRGDRWFLFYLATGYVAFAEVFSWETSRWPSCLVGGAVTSGRATCATLHEGVIRVFWFALDYVNHDNVVAAGTVMIALFTWTLYRSTNKLWIAGEKQIQIAERSAAVAERSLLAANNPIVSITEL
jgi:hypothetical protein